ncbi:MAG: hypothetical protein ACREJX_20515, partial [Polyangiaceae bacterium]
VAYGAGAVAFFVALFYFVHSYGVASANTSTSIDSAIIPATAVANIENTQERNETPTRTASAAPSPKFVASPVAPANVPPKQAPTEADTAREISATPATSATTPRPHSRAQEMSKYFGGRD